ncbi:hypothetical protein NADFUDRAFT_46006 [Nadsonia fulvescens var. elongata DSM 6958]|uniref:Transcription factor CBF/NF-Y/archaeal histone domain-containing protein n=1 Tax=Nadsonia fulvescens var. elongata DSM 6958 TaxID=857566 RepID=A0A1E3PMQ3_9ASCO|nr:hypothetical protein NADFUDRAFT_46006 [Nadsonia fulvescens var. elongata DSM 6958]
MSRKLPRTSLRKIIKHYSGQYNIAKNADALIYVDYILFLKELLRLSAIEAKKTGNKVVSSHHIRKSTQVATGKFRG